MTNPNPASLDLTTFQEVVDLLAPFMLEEVDRRAWLRLALPSAAYRHVQFSGPADIFTIQLVSYLLQYGEVAPGKQAVVALLEILRPQVGLDQQRKIDRLRLKLIHYFQTVTTTALPPPLRISPPGKNQSPSRAPSAWTKSLVTTLRTALILVGLLTTSWLAWTFYPDKGQIQPITPTLAPSVNPATATSIPATTLAPPPEAPLAATPTGDRTQLRNRVVAALRRSPLVTAYPHQAERFVDTLLAHLDEFQLPSLQITPETMQQALDQADVGDRINAVVQEVWGEWSRLSKRQGFDLLTTEPTSGDPNLSPFRQLVIRMIQNRQGILIDNQQYALHNFLTRSEDPDNWRNQIDGIICAVNHDSFQLPCSSP